jgi:hypothetical protein
MSFWDQLLEEFRSLGETLVEWAVLIGVALLVLIIGRWVVKWIARIISKLFGANWMQGIWDRSGVTSALDGSDQTVASITATVVYVYLMTGVVLIAARILDLSSIEQLLERLLAWIPLLVVAVIIVIIAAAAASWTADLVRPFAVEQGVGWLVWVVRVGVIVFGVVFALELLDIEFAGDLVRLVVAAFGIALAIAFGVGGIDSAKLWWAKYGSPGAADRMKDTSSSN